MPNIIHRIGTEKATTQQMYDSVSTIDGLASWWTKNVSGESEVGGVIQFRFSRGGPDFEVIDLKPLTRVEWKCIKEQKE